MPRIVAVLRPAGWRPAGLACAHFLILKVPVAAWSRAGPYPHVRDARRAGWPTELRTQGGIRTPIRTAFKAAASAVGLLGQGVDVALQGRTRASMAAAGERRPAPIGRPGSSWRRGGQRRIDRPKAGWWPIRSARAHARIGSPYRRPSRINVRVRIMLPIMRPRAIVRQRIFRIPAAPRPSPGPAMNSQVTNLVHPASVGGPPRCPRPSKKLSGSPHRSPRPAGFARM
jgi:hypothetical protein